MNYRIQQLIAAFIGIASATALTSCQTATGQGAGIGGAIAALGTAVMSNEDDTGDRRKDIVKAAAIGAAVGAVAGNYVENQQRGGQAYPTQGGDYGHPRYSNSTPHREMGTNYPAPHGRTQYQQQPQHQQPQVQQTNYDQYPFGQRTDRPGVVLSPYSPHWKIDVTGFQSGEAVIDPKTERIFRVP